MQRWSARRRRGDETVNEKANTARQSGKALVVVGGKEKKEAVSCSSAHRRRNRPPRSAAVAGGPAPQGRRRRETTGCIFGDAAARLPWRSRSTRRRQGSSAAPCVCVSVRERDGVWIEVKKSEFSWCRLWSKLHRRRCVPTCCLLWFLTSQLHVSTSLIKLFF